MQWRLYGVVQRFLNKLIIMNTNNKKEDSPTEICCTNYNCLWDGDLGEVDDLNRCPQCSENSLKKLIE